MASFERVNFSSRFSVNIPGRWRLFYLVFAAELLKTLCEPKDVGYRCDFSKNSPNPNLVQHILDSISRSIESPIGLGY